MLFGDIRDSLPLTAHAFCIRNTATLCHSLPLPNLSNRTCKCAYGDLIRDKTSLCICFCSSKQMVFFPNVPPLSALLVTSAPQCRYWAISALHPSLRSLSSSLENYVSHQTTGPTVCPATSSPAQPPTQRPVRSSAPTQP